MPRTCTRALLNQLAQPPPHVALLLQTIVNKGQALSTHTFGCRLVQVRFFAGVCLPLEGWVGWLIAACLGLSHASPQLLLPTRYHTNPPLWCIFAPQRVLEFCSIDNKSQKHVH